jgi:pSer/pThr/pTyr-binding forkhead associated (FHA) protein
VSADREYFDAVEAQSGPDGGPVTFPPYCPLRTFALTGEQMRVGRRSVSRGIAPEIDLTGPPLDPGVSHLHVLLNRMPDGCWQLVDPGSANGTRINDSSAPVPAGEPVTLADGDQIHIGAWTTITLQKGGTL